MSNRVMRNEKESKKRLLGDKHHPYLVCLLVDKLIVPLLVLLLLVVTNNRATIYTNLFSQFPPYWWQ